MALSSCTASQQPAVRVDEGSAALSKASASHALARSMRLLATTAAQGMHCPPSRHSSGSCAETGRPCGAPCKQPATAGNGTHRHASARFLPTSPSLR